MSIIASIFFFRFTINDAANIQYSIKDLVRYHFPFFDSSLFVYFGIMYAICSSLLVDFFFVFSLRISDTAYVRFPIKYFVNYHRPFFDGPSLIFFGQMYPFFIIISINRICVVCLLQRYLWQYVIRNILVLWSLRSFTRNLESPSCFPRKYIRFFFCPAKY